MILEQYYLGCLSQASYLIGDESSGKAAVVDPRRDVDLYLEEARRLGVAIDHVLLTHIHADFLAGHIELRERCGARIALGQRASADYLFEPLRDQDVIQLGEIRLKILETPGHTPESICIVVFDGDPEAVPAHAVLTGDTLFIGDVGRPDLMASAGLNAEDLAGCLHDSLHEKLLPLPDETLVYPGHGAGSMCGKNLSTETVSTMGRQRQFNHALQPMSRPEFINLVTANLPPAPAYFSHDAGLNRAEHQTLEESLAEARRALNLEQVLAHQAAGALLLDVRDGDDFAAGHLDQSLGLSLDGRFASWAGTLIAPDTAMVLVADPGQERLAALRLGRIGFDTVLGHLEGGAEAFAARPDLVRSWQRVPARAESAQDRLVIDVRFPAEWQAGHLPGSRNIPLGVLQEHLAEIPRDRELLLCCKTDYRSAAAAGLLERAGHSRFTDISGGCDAWQAAGLPLQAEDQRQATDDI